MFKKAQGQANHLPRPRGDLGPSAESRQIVSRVRVVLLDIEGEVLAREKLLLRNAAAKPLPVVRQEAPALEADPLQQPFESGIRT